VTIAVNLLVHKTVYCLPSSNLPPTGAPDTNILLLYLVAETDISLLRTFKRVQSFNSQDVDVLSVVLQPFRRFVTTPHVLAETGNFIDQAPQYRRADLLETYRSFIATQDEVYEDARSLTNRDEFAALGLADTGLSSLSSRFTVITMDFQLTGKIQQAGGSVINFQQVRSQRIRPLG